VSFIRARELNALSTFQEVPSVGIKFAEDLVYLEYYSLADIKNKNGAKLIEELEIKRGYWIDSCVEDQFRLVVHFANHRDFEKSWWDFTDERKKYRLKNGYPSSRPQTSWVEVLGITNN